MAILAEDRSAVPVAGVCRKHGISNSTCHHWRSECSGGLIRIAQFRLHNSYTESKNKKGLASISALTPLFSGADGRNRTVDLLITNQLLYQLSYISEARHSSKKTCRGGKSGAGRLIRRGNSSRARLRPSNRGTPPPADAARSAGGRGCAAGRRWPRRRPAR